MTPLEGWAILGSLLVYEVYVFEAGENGQTGRPDFDKRLTVG